MQVSQARYKTSIIITAEQKRNVWTRSGILQILKNEAYKGTYLFNTRTTVNGKQIRRPESEWERLDNNHEVIVSSEDFDKAQQSLTSRISGTKSQVCNQPEEVLLRGLVICEHCGHRLLRYSHNNNNNYFYCCYCRSQGQNMKSCRIDRIEEAIEKELKSRLPMNSPKLSKTNLIREVERLKTQKVSHFQDYKEGLMTRETYMEKRQNLDNSIMEIEEQLKVVGRENIAFDKKLTREVVDTHIERIVVNGQGSFTVVYK